MEAGDFAINDVENNLHWVTTHDAIVNQPAYRVCRVDHDGMGLPAVRTRDVLFYDSFHV